MRFKPGMLIILRDKRERGLNHMIGTIDDFGHLDAHLECWTGFCLHNARSWTITDEWYHRPVVYGSQSVMSILAKYTIRIGLHSDI